MSCGTRQPRSPSVLGRTRRPFTGCSGRLGGAHLDRYADLFDDDLDVVAPVGRRRAHRARISWTVCGLTAPMSIRGRPRSHETRTAKAPLAGLRASLPAPGAGDLDQAVETAGASAVLRFGPSGLVMQASIQING